MAKQTAMSAALLEAIQAAVVANPDLLKKVGKSHKRANKVDAKTTEERKAANDAECIKVFTAAGYADVQPRVNVLTYGKEKPDGTKTGWLGKGRKVKAGEKSYQVGPFRLFHEDQTEVIPAVAAE